MNTSLKLLALFLATALPTALAAESVGLAVPAALDATHLLGAFVVTLLALIVLHDYRSQPRARAYARAAARATPSSRYRLAA